MGELEDRINSVLNDPQQLSEITRLARSFMGGGMESAAEHPDNGPQSAAPAASGLFDQLGLDADALSRLGSVLGASGGSSNSQALLEAMKPYLSDKRKKKMDKAMKLARLAKLAGLAMGEAGGRTND